MSEVDLRESVSCDNCEEFELSKSYSGSSAAISRSEYENITFPDECPVCGEVLRRDE